MDEPIAKPPMVVRCNWCLAVLTEPGALLFTPPDPATNQCFKIHLCTLCYDRALGKPSTAIEKQQPDDVDPETIVRMHLDGRPPRKYVPVDGEEFRETLRAAAVVAKQEALTERWDDAPQPEDEAIRAAFPTRTGKHSTYEEAMRLVGARHSKGALVALVNWLLAERDELLERVVRSI